MYGNFILFIALPSRPRQDILEPSPNQNQVSYHVEPIFEIQSMTIINTLALIKESITLTISCTLRINQRDFHNVNWKVPLGRERPLVTTMYHCRFPGSAHKEVVCNCFSPDLPQVYPLMRCTDMHGKPPIVN